MDLDKFIAQATHNATSQNFQQNVRMFCDSNKNLPNNIHISQSEISIYLNKYFKEYETSATTSTGMCHYCEQIMRKFRENDNLNAVFCVYIKWLYTQIYNNTNKNILKLKFQIYNFFTHLQMGAVLRTTDIPFLYINSALLSQNTLESCDLYDSSNYTIKDFIIKSSTMSTMSTMPTTKKGGTKITSTKKGNTKITSTKK